MVRFNERVEEGVEGAYGGGALEHVRHSLEHVQSFIGHAVFGIGFEERERHLLGAGAANGGDYAGRVGEEEGGVGGQAAEDVVEDGGGGGKAGAVDGGVEEMEGRERGLLGFEELEKSVGREGFGKLHHHTGQWRRWLKQLSLHCIFAFFTV